VDYDPSEFDYHQLRREKRSHVCQFFVEWSPVHWNVLLERCPELIAGRAASRCDELE
jgi:hypothetical protein